MSLGNDLFNVFDSFANIFTDNNLEADVIKDENGYRVIVNIPGVKKENVKLDFSNSELTVTVNKSDEENNQEYVCKERIAPRGVRTFYLKDADEKNVKAKISDGILEVTVGLLKSNSKEIVIE